MKADSSVTVSLKAGNVSFDAAAAILAAEGLTAWKDGFYAGAVPFAALFGSADVSALTFDSLTVSVAGGGVLRIDALDAVVYGKTVVAGTKTPQFNILGASVRGENDIRFGLQIDDRYWNAGSQITAVSFGAIVVPTALLGGELTLESADVLRIKTEKWQLGIVDADGAPYAGDVYTAVVLDVPDMDTQLTARGYMVFVADGVEYVTYTAPVTRTIREVYAAAGIDPGAAA